MKVRKLLLNAFFIAMYVVLSYVSINLGNMVITVSAIPIIMGGMLFGPIAGLEIGLIGSFLNQMLKYGITPTTILWILPAGVRGGMIGFYAKQNEYQLHQKQILFIILFSGFVVTTLNTAVMYIDSKLYGYYSFAYVFGALIARYISAVFTSMIYFAIIQVLLKYTGIFEKNTFS